MEEEAGEAETDLDLNATGDLGNSEEIPDEEETDEEEHRADGEVNGEDATPDVIDHQAGGDGPEVDENNNSKEVEGEPDREVADDEDARPEEPLQEEIALHPPKPSPVENIGEALWAINSSMQAFMTVAQETLTVAKASLEALKDQKSYLHRLAKVYEAMPVPPPLPPMYDPAATSTTSHSQASHSKSRSQPSSHSSHTQSASHSSHTQSSSHSSRPSSKTSHAEKSSKRGRSRSPDRPRKVFSSNRGPKYGGP